MTTQNINEILQMQTFLLKIKGGEFLAWYDSLVHTDKELYKVAVSNLNTTFSSKIKLQKNEQRNIQRVFS